MNNKNLKKTIEERTKFLDVSPDLSVDCATFTLIDGRVAFLGSKRNDLPNDPFPNNTGMAGVYFNIKLDKSMEDAAVRSLRQKAHLKNIPYIEQLNTFANKERDPRWFTATTVFIAYVNFDDIKLESDDVYWVFEDEFDHIDWAFDHKEIIKYALKKLRKQAAFSAKIINFLPNEFTQTQLQNLYEIILNEKLDKSSFRKQLKDNELLQETKNMVKPPKGKPAKAYKISSNFDINEDYFFPSSIRKRAINNK
jgi:8-oxo-dGTP diphosphatase